MTSALCPGPRCERCRCFAAEHEQHIDTDWSRVPGRCLSCECPGFTANGQMVASFLYVGEETEKQPVKSSG